MFYLTLMSSLLAGDFFLWWRADLAVRALRRAVPWRAAVAGFILIQIGFMLRILFAPYVARHDSNLVIVLGFCLAYAWHLLVVPATLLVMAAFKCLATLRTKMKPARPITPPVAGSITLPVAPPVDQSGDSYSRRDVLRSAAVAVPPLLALGGLGIAASELSQFRIRRLIVPLKALPAALDGMTIAQVSDTHIGRFTNDRLLDSIAEATNELNADLTLFVGDLIDIAQADLDPAIAFAKRLRGRFGVYFCEGNHDLIEDAYRKTHVFETRTRVAGLPMLFDESVTIHVRDYPVQLIGARWDQKTADRVMRSKYLMTRRDPDAFSIFMTHHPHGWDDSLTPLTLSGHTHGGQLMLNERVGVGPIMFRYWSGLYRRGDQALVVCNGTGNWFPVRTMAPAEIIHLTLTRSA